MHRPEQISSRELPFGRVSVTGGTGTVGSQFIKVLLAQFPHVEQITTSCRPGSRQGRISDDPRVNVLRGGLEDIDVLRGLVAEGEILFHLAAWLANTSMPEPTVVYIANALATAVLAKLAHQAGKPLVYTSSHSVYFAGPYEGRIEEDTFAFRRDFVDWIQEVHGEYEQLAGDLIAGRAGCDEAPARLGEIHGRLTPPWEPTIYGRDEYHIYCLTKLLGERFVLDHGGVVLRLANVYGPGDESTQAVAEACQRILAADPDVETTINQPFKKLVPCHLGDIIRCLVRASTLRLPEGVSPVFTVASEPDYLREDALLRTVAEALAEIRGEGRTYRIETLPPEKERAFTYELAKMRKYLLPGETLTPLREGVAGQLAWLIDRAEGKPPRRADLSVTFAAPR